MELSAATWDKTITNSKHVWVVKFHSKMCGTCQEFMPEWEKLSESVEGLHWGELNIDKKENVAVAKGLGVLKEGIPNIKVFDLASEPSPLMTGDTIPAIQLMPALEQLIASSGAEEASSHFYVAPRARSEL